MSHFYDCILIKNAVNGNDLVSIIQNGEPTLYLTNTLSDSPIGQLDCYEVSHTWLKLSPKIFLPLIKHDLMLLSCISGAENTGQAIQEKRIYDYFIQKAERQLPRNLRKVMSMDAAIATIKSKSLKFTPPSKFNDFQEGFANFTDINYEPVDEQGQAITNYDQLIDKFYVTCFGEGPWNNLALSIYGDEGKGAMFIFNSQKLEECYRHRLEPIKYLFDEPNLGILNSDEKIYNALQAKHISWEYEKEWRFIIRKEKVGESSNHLEDSSVVLPFHESALLYIYVGPKADTMKRQELLDAIVDSGLNDTVKVYQLSNNNLAYNRLTTSLFTINRRRG